MDSMAPLEGMAGGDVSSELAAILRSIADITVDQRPKFSPKLHRQLVRAIVCRNYASPLHELCHLIVGAERIFGNQGFERLFWASGDATAAAFRRQILDPGNKNIIDTADLTPTENGIKLLYPDGTFSIAYSRMPFLSALMEFLLSSLGYGEIDELIRATPATRLGKKDVAELANSLARRVYAYLSTHLPTAQSQRKFRAVLSFLRQSKNGTAQAEDIDDDAVLAFWICTSANDRIEGDFRSFRSVFRLMVAIRDALGAESSHRAIAYAKPIGTDWESGEVDPGNIGPDEVEAAFEASHERGAPLDTLDSPPANGVKFFKQADRAVITPIMEAGDAASALPLSLLRAQIMGDVQARMIQALRRGEDPLAVARLGDEDALNHSYATHMVRLDQIRETLEQVLLATLHRLISARNAEAIGIMLALRPKMDLTPLARLFDDPAASDDDVVRLDPPVSENRLWQILTASASDCPDLSELLTACEAAAKRITRKGFRGDNNIEETAAFEAASEALLAIRAALARNHNLYIRLAEALGGWEARYAADTRIFSSHFKTLYGDRL